MRDRMSRRNARHFGGKAEPRFRRSRQIKNEGLNFYLAAAAGTWSRLASEMPCISARHPVADSISTLNKRTYLKWKWNEPLFLTRRHWSNRNDEF
jgi:hypothetical protein